MLKRIKTINWENGNGMLLMSVFITLVGLMFMFLVMEYNNVYAVGAVAQTRADAIADSTAVYAVSYDNTFNSRAAYEQTVLLTAYNNNEKTPINTSLDIIPDGSGKNTRLEVFVTAVGKFFFSRSENGETFEVTRKSGVEIVDTAPDVVVIP
jgi:hypothetical protein